MLLLLFMIAYFDLLRIKLIVKN